MTFMTFEYLKYKNKLKLKSVENVKLNSRMYFENFKKLSAVGITSVTKCQSEFYLTVMNVNQILNSINTIFN